MKRIFILYAAVAISVTACVNRTTHKDPDAVQLEEKDVKVTEEDMFQTSGDSVDTEANADSENIEDIGKAKEVINDYFNALDSSNLRDAYDLMDAKSSRGTFADFSDSYAQYETVNVTFTDDPKVVKDSSKVTVTVPVRMTAVNKNGNTESYLGEAVLNRENNDDGKYTITQMQLTREDS